LQTLLLPWLENLSDLHRFSVLVCSFLTFKDDMSPCAISALPGWVKLDA
jgi:hypothetical protein